MVNTTAAFKTAMSQSYRELKSRLTLGANVISDGYIQKITQEDGIIFGDDFQIGIAAMSTLEVELFDLDGLLPTDFEDKEMNVEIATCLADLSYEYVSLGLFTVEKAIGDRKGVKLSCCDRMYKFEKEYVSTLVYPATILQIAQDICSKAGVTLKNTSFTNSTYSVVTQPVIEGVTLRKAIAQVAELAGGYARITRDGKLEIFNIGTTSQVSITQSNYSKFTNNNLVRANIDKVIVKLGGEQATAGTGSNPFYIVDNMFVTNPNSVVSALYTQLNGLTYMPYQMDWAGNQSLDCGDKITVTSSKGTYTTIIASKKLAYKGGLKETYSAPAKSNTERNSTGKGSIHIRMENYDSEIKVLKNEITQRVTKEVFDDLGARVGGTESLISQQADQISQKVTQTQVDTSIKAIQIGGRNLFRNTDFAGVSKKHTRITGGGTEAGFIFTPTTQVGNLVDYTISARIRGVANLNCYQLNTGGNSATAFVRKTDISDTEYRLFKLTFQVASGKILNQLYICTMYGEPNTLVGDWFEIEPSSLKLEKGSKATDWTPAVEDIQAAVDTAQTQANLGVTNAAIANSLLADIASDSKLTAREKINLKKEWDNIVSEVTQNDAQATSFGVSAQKTPYDTAYTALSTYVTPLLSNLATTSTIVGTTFRTNFKTYYDARVALLNAIAAKAKALADTAQTSANNANTKVDDLTTRVTSTESSITQQATEIALKVTQTEVDTAKAAAISVASADATAKADAASTLANNAQSTANTAVSNAATANTALADIASDSKLTPLEKQTIKAQWDVIVAEKTANDTQANTFGVVTQKTTYGTVYTTLSAYIAPLLANLTTTSTIVRTTFNANFKAYYDARTALLNAIADKARTLANTAQNAADTAIANFVNYSTTTEMTSAITQKAGEISLSVSKEEISKLTLGGANVIPNSVPESTSDIAGWSITGAGAVLVAQTLADSDRLTYPFKYRFRLANTSYYDGTTVPQTYAYGEEFRVKPNTKYTVSGYYYIGSGAARIQMHICGRKAPTANGTGANYDYITTVVTDDVYSTGNHKYFTFTFTTKADEVFAFLRVDNDGTVTNDGVVKYIYFGGLKMEEGDKATAWSPAEISSRLFKAESTLTQTAESITAKFSSLGSGNLIRNSSGFGGTEYWWGDAVYSIGTTTLGNSHSKKTIRVSNNGLTTLSRAYSARFVIEPSTKYTLSGWMFRTSASLGAEIWAAVADYELDDTTFMGLPAGSTYYSANKIEGADGLGWEYFSHTFTTSATARSAIIRLDNKGATASGTAAFAYFTDLKLERGEVATDWCPHSSEVYDGITTITKDGIKVAHTNAGSSYSTMTPDGFMRYDGVSEKAYHYLSYVGTATVSYSTPITITLPAEFKGKAFKITVSVKSVSVSGAFVMGFNCSFDTINVANGTFRIVAYATSGSYSWTASTVYDSTVSQYVLTQLSSFNFVAGSNVSIQVSYTVIA